MTGGCGELTKNRYAGVKILFKPPQIASVSDATTVKREVFIGEMSSCCLCPARFPFILSHFLRISRCLDACSSFFVLFYGLRMQGYFEYSWPSPLPLAVVVTSLPFIPYGLAGIFPSSKTVITGAVNWAGVR